MTAYFRIVDGDKQLASELDPKDSTTVLKAIKNGTFWAYRGDNKKRPNAKKVRMKYVEGELV